MSEVAAFKQLADSADRSPASGRITTDPPELSLRTIVHAAWLRRAGTALLFVFIALGAASVFGVRDGEVTAAAAGYEMTVHYAEVTRPGLDTPWSVRIARQGGFDGPVELRTTAAYFTMFDENGLSPDPAATRLDGKYIVFEFDRPAGDELVVDWDARLSPAVQQGASAETAVIEDGVPVVSVNYETKVMP